MNPAHALNARARRVLPGGVTASARANPALGHPMYLSRGEGAHVFDLEGRRYIDFCTSHGASLLGHGHPGVRAAVAQALEIGTLCAAETEHSIRLAEQLVVVDHLSQGRLSLILGTGYRQEEFDMIGLAFSDRLSVLEHHVTALRQAFTARSPA